MTNIAFLGLGAMGSRMAHRLLDAGFALSVWNRSQSATEALRTSGARIAETPRDAVEGADIVISMVRDDAASEAVWLTPETGAVAGLASGAIAIEASTVTPTWVRILAGKVAGKGAALLDAPVAGSRPQAEAGQLIFMVGGEPSVLETVRPALDAMGGAVHHAGGSGAGATAKLMVNALFGTQLALLAELLGFCERAGISPDTAIDILGSTPVCSPAAKLAAQSMLAGQWAPAFPIDLVAKDFRLIATAVRDADGQAPICDRVQTVFEKAVEEGFGADNITGVIQLYRNGLRRV